MKLRNIALLASLTVFAAAVTAAPKKAPPVKPAAAKVDPKAAAAAAQAEAEAKAKLEAEAKAKAEADKGGSSWYTFGGNLVQAYIFNPDKPADGYNGTLTWTDRA